MADGGERVKTSTSASMDTYYLASLLTAARRRLHHLAPLREARTLLALRLLRASIDCHLVVAQRNLPAARAALTDLLLWSAGLIASGQTDSITLALPDDARIGTTERLLRAASRLATQALDDTFDDAACAALWGELLIVARDVALYGAAMPLTEIARTVIA